MADGGVQRDALKPGHTGNAIAAGVTGPDGVRVRNLLSTKVIPWARVEGCRIGRYKLLSAVCIIELLEGGSYHAFAIQVQEVVCHNDFAPYNLMLDDGTLTGVIDLDLASPGPRVWDVAYTAYRFVPLTDPANPDAPFPGLQAQFGRLAAFCAAYGLSAVAPPDVLKAAAANLRELVAFIERQAAARDAAQQAVLARGDVDLYRRDIAHIEHLATR